MPDESISRNDDAQNNHQISVVLLAGLPASGKSTLARKLHECLNQDNGTNALNNSLHTERPRDMRRLIHHIEYDDLEDHLLASNGVEKDATEGNSDEIANQRREAWNQARQRAVEQLEKEIQKIVARAAPCINPSPLVTNHIILMDDNFHLRGMRKQIHRLLLNYRPIRFGILYLKIPLEVCLERNSKRSGRRRIPHEVIEKMSTSFEPPRVAWEVSSTKTIVDSDFAKENSKAFEEIVQFVRNCPDIVDLPCDEMDLEQQASDRAKTRENEVHGLDKLLRSYVGRVAKFDKSLAKNANLARKRVMEDFKAGRIDNTGVMDAFLELVVPEDSSSTNEKDSDANSTIRSNLQKTLEQ